MKRSNKDATKPRGRPPVDTTAVNVRLRVGVLQNIDDWRREQSDIPNRPEAIRRLVEMALSVSRRGREGKNR